jgi:transposase
MNAEQAIDCIKTTILPFIDEIKASETNVKLLWDGAKPHIAANVTQFLEDNDINYYKFGGHPINHECGYPPNSPDMNPIELIFGILQQQVSIRHPQTINELQKVVEEEWKNISVNTIRACYERLKKVIPYVISNNGDIYSEK